MDATIFSYITAFLYLAISGFQFRQLSLHTDAQSKNIALLSVIPILSHGWLLHESIDTAMGQNLSMFNMFSMVFWIIAILIIISSTQRKLGTLVVTVLPMAALSIVMTNLWGDQNLIDASSIGYLSHSLFSIAALSLISLAAIQSVYVNNLDKKLRSFTASSDSSMPSLQDMEQFLYVLIWSGFALLSVSILTAINLYMPGDMPASTTDNGSTMPLHKPILSVASWLVFAIFLIGRTIKGWRGKTATRWTMAGFILLFLAYFGTRAALEVFLGK